MSNRRIIRLLLWGIFILTGIHLYFFLRGVGKDLLPRQTLMDAPPTDAPITQIVVARRGAPEMILQPAVLDATNAMTFVRAGDWRLTRPYASLVEDRFVRRLLDALILSPIKNRYREQELLEFARKRSDFGLEDPDVRVTLTSGGKDFSFGFGNTTPTGGGVFASIEGDGDVYVVGTGVREAVGLPTDGYRLRDLCPKGTQTVEGFLLKRGGGAVTSFRQKDGVWSKIRMGEEEVAEPASARNVRELLQRLAVARAVDFVWPVGATNEPEITTAPLLAQYGLDPETAVTLTLQRPNSSDRDQISFGKPATNGLVYALIQDNRAIVTLDGDLCEFVRTTDFADTRLFPLEADGLTRLSLTDDALTCRLVKGEDGAWLMEEPVAAAADAANVKVLIDHLLTLSISNRVDKGLSVSLNADGPSEIVARDAVLGEFALADLRTREILRLPAADVRRVTVPGKDKPTSVVYDKDLRCWKVESSANPGTVVDAAVTGLLEALAPLTAEKVVLLKALPEDLRRYGLEEPRYRIAVDPAQEGNLRRIILIGKPAQGGSFATLVGASESVFILSDATVRRLTAPLVAE